MRLSFTVRLTPFAVVCATFMSSRRVSCQVRWRPGSAPARNSALVCHTSNAAIGEARLRVVNGRGQLFGVVRIPGAEKFGDGGATRRAVLRLGGGVDSSRSSREARQHPPMAIGVGNY